MYKYIFQRLSLGIITIFIIVFVVYTLQLTFLEHPLKQIYTATNDAGATNSIGGVASESLSKPSLKTSGNSGVLDVVDLEFAKYHVNSPVIVQFFYYVKGLFQGTLGPIYTDSSRQIWNTFSSPMKYSALLSLPPYIVSVILGVLLGIIAGYNRGKWIDNLINGSTNLMTSLPAFVTAPIALALAFKIGLPTIFLRPDQPGSDNYQSFLSLLTPWIVLTIGGISSYLITTRNWIITILTSNYILIAKTKGLSGTKIFFRYVFRNIAIQLSGIIFSLFTVFLTTGVVMESFFQVPGSSSLILNYVVKNEVNVIAFQALFYSTLSTITAILSDLLYVLINPTIKFSTNNFKTIEKLKNFVAKQKFSKLYQQKKQLLTKEKN